MPSSRTSAARRLRRFFAPASLSVLLHVFFALQAAPALPDVPAEPAPIDIYLTPLIAPLDAPVSTPRVVSQPTIPVGREPKPRRKEGVPTTAASAIFALPPWPAGLGPLELTLVPRDPGERAGPPAPSRGADGHPPIEPDPPIAPLLPALPGQERSGNEPRPSGAGAGFTFDFWSPPVFEEEMARAAETIGRAEAEFQREKTTDLGHGVICNTGNGWFVCADDDIARCNRDHDGNCRYAKTEERYQLEIDHIF